MNYISERWKQPVNRPNCPSSFRKNNLSSSATTLLSALFYGEIMQFKQFYVSLISDCDANRHEFFVVVFLKHFHHLK